MLACWRVGHSMDEELPLTFECPEGYSAHALPRIPEGLNLLQGFVCLDDQQLDNVGAAALQCAASCFGDPEPISGFDLFSTGILLCLSGLFSGLTLGLMSLDLAQLRIVISGGSPREAQCALKILPLRRKGNLLLCTLLIGNTLVNAMIAIVSAGFTGGVAGTILSTTFIVIFGEISPQSVCARHGLEIGAATIPLVKMFMMALFPVAWPISVILDQLLGEEMGTTYNKKELSVLMEMHVNDGDTPLTVRDQRIFTGMMQMSELVVRNVMTPLVDVYMLEERDNLTFDAMLEIYKKGYTRIPVYRRTKSHVIGLLYTKDLIMVDPEDDLPVDRVLEFCSRELLSVDSDTSLDLMFQQVESGRSHLYFVQNEESDVETATQEVRGVIGIVTLEDVVEELIQKEIVDESDIVRDNVTKRVAHGVDGAVARRIEFFRMMQSADKRTENRELTLTDGETTAVTSFLASNVKCMTKYQDGSDVPEEMLYAFVKRCKVDDLDGHSATPIYLRGQASDRCSIVLGGHLKVIAGEEGFESETGSWTILGLSALTQSVYIPDFTAKVTSREKARVMYIGGEDFRNFSQGKRVPRRSFDQSMSMATGPLAAIAQASARSLNGRVPALSIANRRQHAISIEEETRRLDPVTASPKSNASSGSPGSPRLKRRSPKSTPVNKILSPPTSSVRQDQSLNQDGGFDPSEPSIFRLHSVEKNPYKEDRNSSQSNMSVDSEEEEGDEVYLLRHGNDDDVHV